MEKYHLSFPFTDGSRYMFERSNMEKYHLSFHFISSYLKYCYQPTRQAGQVTVVRRNNTYM